ncbi:MAG: recombinase family protein [Planctomycetes bacterium]|nr:recombinase family protein [Planctomycetota bacterium]
MTRNDDGKGSRTRVIGYVRVSTEAQADEGVSLEAQQAKLSSYAQLYDLELTAVIADAGATGKTLDRPGLQRALAQLDAGDVDGLLVAKLDRLTRSVRDLGTLLDRGFRDRFALMSVAEQVDTRSAAGRLVLNVLCSVAEWERETIGERTREALAHLRASGARLGGAALGWARADERDAAGRLVVVPLEEEAATVDRILELRREGLSLRAIAARLANEQRRTKRGGAWHPQTIRAVLRRVA